VFRDILLSAVVAGLVAAFAMTLVQSTWVSPLILQAEVYEDAADHASARSEHHHDASAWKPEDVWSRRLFAFAANVLMGVGYAFLLIAVYIFWRHPPNAAFGLLYGVVGFVAFFVSPGLGLPPELPGTATAELASRQYWWVATVIATAVGFALIFAQPHWRLRAVGVAILILPHLIAAPHAAVERTLAPPELQSQFRVATTVCNGIFWLTLGWSSAFFYQKLFLAKIRP
jgi:cobalt transporter subunit CbtA